MSFLWVCTASVFDKIAGSADIVSSGSSGACQLTVRELATTWPLRPVEVQIPQIHMHWHQHTRTTMSRTCSFCRDTSIRICCRQDDLGIMAAQETAKPAAALDPMFHPRARASRCNADLRPLSQASQSSIFYLGQTKDKLPVPVGLPSSVSCHWLQEQGNAAESTEQAVNFQLICRVSLSPYPHFYLCFYPLFPSPCSFLPLPLSIPDPDPDPDHDWDPSISISRSMSYSGST